LVLLPVDVTSALLGEDNLLRRTGELVLAFEKADWRVCERLASRLRVPESAINQAHMEAVEWAQRLQLA
jgi:c-di-GMP-related signal transduction protein